MVNTESPLYKSLTNIGFSEKEANVYLALLELGKRSVSAIGRKAGINRTTTYDILESLVSKGLVSISGKEPLQEYVAESPEKILKLIEKQIEEKNTNLKTAGELIPQLKSLHNVSNRSQIRFYEGKEGLMEVYENTLTSSEPIRAYASVEDTQHTLPDYFPKYYKRRATKGIPIRAIFPKTPEAVELSLRNKEENRETALIPAEQFSFSPEINIYDNKVMIASWKEKLGIIIESHEIADAMKKIFELAWAESKRLEKNI